MTKAQAHKLDREAAAIAEAAEKLFERAAAYNAFVFSGIEYRPHFVEPLNTGGMGDFVRELRHRPNVLPKFVAYEAARKRERKEAKCPGHDMQPVTPERQKELGDPFNDGCQWRACTKCGYECGRADWSVVNA